MKAAALISVLLIAASVIAAAIGISANKPQMSVHCTGLGSTTVSNIVVQYGLCTGTVKFYFSGRTAALSAKDSAFWASAGTQPEPGMCLWLKAYGHPVSLTLRVAAKRTVHLWKANLPGNGTAQSICGDIPGAANISWRLSARPASGRNAVLTLSDLSFIVTGTKP